MPTMFARSDIGSVSIGPGHNGCGETHVRPTDERTGQPVQPWGLNCPMCCEHLATDTMWSASVEDIAPTFDEAKAAEQYQLRGAQARDALMAAAIAQLAGYTPGQIPAVIQRQIAGLAPHVPLAGQMACPDGHFQAAGMKFCGECGQPMSARVPAAQLTSGAAA